MKKNPSKYLIAKIIQLKKMGVLFMDDSAYI